MNCKIDAQQRVVIRISAESKFHKLYPEQPLAQDATNLARLLTPRLLGFGESFTTHGLDEIIQLFTGCRTRASAVLVADAICEHPDVRVVEVLDGIKIIRKEVSHVKTQF